MRTDGETEIYDRFISVKFTHFWQEKKCMCKILLCFYSDTVVSCCSTRSRIKHTETRTNWKFSLFQRGNGVIEFSCKMYMDGNLSLCGTLTVTSSSCLPREMCEGFNICNAWLPCYNVSFEFGWGGGEEKTVWSIFMKTFNFSNTRYQYTTRKTWIEAIFY